MATSSSPLTLEIGAVFIVALLVLAVLYFLNRYIRRRGGELATREGRSVLDDRSYNQIRIARAAAERLQRTGVDVTTAQSLLDRAETARTSGSYDSSIDLAKKAQQALASSRSGPPTLSASPSTRPAVSARLGATGVASPMVGPAAYSAAATPVSGPGAGSSAISTSSGSGIGLAPPSRPPKNKMEARFQLSLASEELDPLRADESGTKSFQEADRLRADAQAAYDRNDFTEALRLALRSRRALGTRVEGLPAPTPPSGGAVSASGAAVAAPLESSSTGSAPPGQKCPQCGRLATTEDQFCRACGGPIPPTLCTTCGVPLHAGDRFCGACGAVQA